ncbi:MAG: class A beta-lactamase-related serine hydrolase [Leptolyngbya sp. PLA1]|nr:class A beta-lactamase-related serine hydrolase [Leptolyngbya sp. PLA1]
MQDADARAGSLRLLGRAAVNSLCALHPALAERRVSEAVSRGVPARLRRLRIPGFQYALVVGDRPVVSAALGVAHGSTGEAMTVASRFRVASLSKPVAALVLLQAAARGELDADATIEPYVPEWDWSGARRPVTVRRLLRHDAGLPTLHPTHVRDDEPAVLKMEGVPGVGGTRGYSGLNYVAAQLAAERMTGVTFEQMAARHVFEPLGMEGTGFGGASREGTVGFHDEVGRELPRMWSPALAGSGLVATAAQIATILREAMRAMRGLGSVIAREAACEVLVPRDGAPFACGLAVAESPDVRTHGGVRPGYRGFIIVDLRVRVGCVLLANGEYGGEVNRPVSGLVADLAARLRA